MNEFHRCVICNAVSSNEIAEDHEYVCFGRYTYDQEEDGFVCHECTDAVEDALRDFDDEEEFEDE